MIKEAIGVGATVEEAAANAKVNLNAPIDADITIEIISREKKKILGLFGGSAAKVKAFYDDGVKEEKKAPEKKSEGKKGDSKKLTHYVKNTLKEKWILTQYQDPETEIKAQNHFVLKINN